MTRRFKLTAFLSVAWFVLGTAYHAHRGGVLQLVTAPLFFGMLVAIVLNFVWIFKDWRRFGWRSTLPFLMCLFSLASSFVVAMKIHDYLFERSLPQYQALVQNMQTGSIVLTTNWRSMPELVSQAPLAYSVAAWKDTNDALTVEILTEGGFPVKHSGYLFNSAGQIAPRSFADKRWPIKRQLKPQWFYISD